MSTHMALTFDTLAYANKLKIAGVPERQAEAHAEAIAELVTDHLATKRDLKELELRLDAKLQKLSLQIKELELRMIIKLGVMVVGSMTLLVVLLKLFHL